MTTLIKIDQNKNPIKKPFLLLLFTLFFCGSCQKNINNNKTTTQKTSENQKIDSIIKPKIAEVSCNFQLGNERLELYMPLLKDKSVALVVNHTSLIKSEQHLVDFLLEKKVNIKVIFAPEHGFRGTADAGELVKNGIDTKTNLPIISLYGNNKKPTNDQLKDIDVVIFDIQDVGARFYTYISTMHYVMEACAENQKKMIVLDRPNPNNIPNEVIDGCILDKNLTSFVGMHEIPILHGLTVGELALMINGQKWLKNGVQCDLSVVKYVDFDCFMENINNKIETASAYEKIPFFMSKVPPSPNLRSFRAVKLYASLCLFEGTIISVGRGTETPFELIGYPDKVFGDFSFAPKSIIGMAKTPLFENQECFGVDFRDVNISNYSKKKQGIDLDYLIDFYKKRNQKDPKQTVFFNSFFDKLAGSSALRLQIIAGKSAKEIKKSWQKDLDNYKIIRKKYLLYQNN